jgi:hypothetical protein
MDENVIISSDAEKPAQQKSIPFTMKTLNKGAEKECTSVRSSLYIQTHIQRHSE